MVRGRKRDISAPLTRSLLLQRDYRARKAKYISDIETRCQKLENENSKLSKEIKELKHQLRQRVMERKETCASLITDADIEKSRALNVVIFSLASAAASIKSFQSLTVSDDYDASEESLGDRKRGLPSPPTTVSNLSPLPDSTGLSAHNFQPVRLYSPVSTVSTSPSLPISSSRTDSFDSWNSEFTAQGFPSDTNPNGPTTQHRQNLSHMRPQSVDSHSNVYPPDPLVDLSASSTQPRRASASQNFFEVGCSASPSKHERFFNRLIPVYDSSSDQVTFTSNRVLPQEHPMAPYTYERTLSRSLRDFS
ncbi:hypothetical protein J3R30DRAFT_3623991 [Lentinula aciculospora]|uniref:BZIP domain-containing protein n=1 Tax=Lentinula aciculospora TaxID=153920 RepID=A0A9W8ZT44_9AGAR|nr:hypothetical protein J3R30DRAFT_3623991 [Lentinula aciculospora]